ncbi:hypothetical protein WG909_11035 [Peptostreptococcaceae bacterium AGR-M142]
MKKFILVILYFSCIICTIIMGGNISAVIDIPSLIVLILLSFILTFTKFDKNDIPKTLKVLSKNTLYSGAIISTLGLIFAFSSNELNVLMLALSIIPLLYALIISSLLENLI